MMYDDLVKRLREDAPTALANCDFDFIEGWIKEAADAIEELNVVVRAQKAVLDKFPKWIPVTERLPEDGIEVNIVWCNHNPVIYYQHIKDKPQTATGVYYRGKWYWWSAVVQDYLEEYGEWEPDKMDAEIEVTHWMPLPEPPIPEPPKEELVNFGEWIPVTEIEVTEPPKEE